MRSRAVARKFFVSSGSFSFTFLVAPPTGAPSRLVFVRSVLLTATRCLRGVDLNFIGELIKRKLLYLKGQ